MSTYWRTTPGDGDGHSETLPERVDRYLSEYPDAFEREYVQVGKAWLDWHDGNSRGARTQLRELVDRLPGGSVPRETAAWLIEQMDEGGKPPKRLVLVDTAK